MISRRSINRALTYASWIETNSNLLLPQEINSNTFLLDELYRVVIQNPHPQTSGTLFDKGTSMLQVAMHCGLHQYIRDTLDHSSLIRANGKVLAWITL